MLIKQKMQEKTKQYVWFLIIFQYKFTHTDYSCNYNLTANRYHEMSAIGHLQTFKN